MNLIIYEFDRLLWFIEEFSIKNSYPNSSELFFKIIFLKKKKKNQIVGSVNASYQNISYSYWCGF